MLPTGFLNAARSSSQALSAAGPEEEFHLVRQIIEGRTERFAELVEPQMPVLLRIVGSRMRRHPDVEDIVQETLLKAYTRIRQFRFESSFATWVTRIAINEVRQWYRRPAQSHKNKLEDLGIEECKLTGVLPSPLTIFERREKMKHLESAIAALPVKYRDVIRLRELEELSIVETSQALNMTISAVKTRHRRARLYIRRYLKPYEPSDTSNKGGRINALDQAYFRTLRRSILSSGDTRAS
jgi:RNA polymerase sigma-70 factor, ECF subfamily